MVRTLEELIGRTGISGHAVVRVGFGNDSHKKRPLIHVWLMYSDSMLRRQNCLFRGSD